MISARAAARFLLVGLGALAVFHLSVLVGVVPAELVWGGRAAGSPGSVRLLEVVGIVVTALFAAVVAAKAGYLRPRPPGKAVAR